MMKVIVGLERRWFRQEREKSRNEEGDGRLRDRKLYTLSPSLQTLPYLTKCPPARLKSQHQI